MRVRSTNGCWMGYEDVGQGQPVVLLHAFPLRAEMWRPQIDALGNQYRVVAPDLRGFGGTEPFDGTPSIETMADDVLGLLDAIKITEPVVLGGQSMGGYIALAFARKYPDRLRALVLADTRAEADTAEGKANRNTSIAFAEAHTPAEFVEPMLAKLLGETTRERRPEVVAEVRRLGSTASVAGIVGALKAMRDRPDAGPSLGRIAVPALVIVGSEDTITPPSLADALASRIRNARKVLISGAGHLANLEQPGPFTEALRSFLTTLPAGPG